MHYVFNPPADVMRRQFCSMAREFGFGSATDFALVVESWTPEQRRNCLEAFYRVREVKVLEGELARLRKEEEEEEEEGKTNGERKKGQNNKEDEDGVEGNDGMERVKGEGEGGNVGVKREDALATETVSTKTENVERRRVPTIFLSDDDEDDEL
ncbi:hypothetical protein VTK26DRAFT_2961 [Humicola hyalothermophila]